MAERLIDAELLKNTTKRLLEEQEAYGFYPKSWDEEVIAFKCLIDSMPTIEAKPIVHAHWEKYDDSEFCYCSNCGEPAADDESVSWSGYCPICGAQMDEEVSE